MSGPSPVIAASRGPSSSPSDDALLEGIQEATNDNPVLRECCEQQRKQDEVKQEIQDINQRLERRESVEISSIDSLKAKLSGLETTLSAGAQTLDVRDGLKEISALNERLDTIVVAHGALIQREVSTPVVSTGGTVEPSVLMGSQNRPLSQFERGEQVATSRAEVAAWTSGGRAEPQRLSTSARDISSASVGGRIERVEMIADQARVGDVSTNRTRTPQTGLKAQSSTETSSDKDRSGVTAGGILRREELVQPRFDRKVVGDSTHRAAEPNSSMLPRSTGDSLPAGRPSTERALSVFNQQRQGSDGSVQDQRLQSSRAVQISQSRSVVDVTSAKAQREASRGLEPGIKNKMEAERRTEEQGRVAVSKRSEGLSTVADTDIGRASAFNRFRLNTHREGPALIPKVRESSRAGGNLPRDQRIVVAKDGSRSMAVDVARGAGTRGASRLNSPTGTSVETRGRSSRIVSPRSERQAAARGGLNEAVPLKGRVSMTTGGSRLVGADQSRGRTAADPRVRTGQRQESGFRRDKSSGNQSSGMTERRASQVLPQTGRGIGERLREGLRLAKRLVELRDGTERSLARRQNRDGDRLIRSDKQRGQSGSELTGIVRSAQRTQSEIIRRVRSELVPLGRSERQAAARGGLNEAVPLKGRVSMTTGGSRLVGADQSRGRTAADPRVRTGQRQESGFRRDKSSGNQSSGMTERRASQVLPQTGRGIGERLREGLRLAKRLVELRDGTERSLARRQNRDGDRLIRSDKQRGQSGSELTGIVRSAQRTQSEIIRLVRSELVPLGSRRGGVALISVVRQVRRILERIKDLELRDVKTLRGGDLVRSLRNRQGNGRLDRVHREALKVVRQYLRILERRLQQSVDPRTGLYKRLTTELTVSDLERLVSMLGGARAARGLRRKGRRKGAPALDESDLTKAVLEELAGGVGGPDVSGSGDSGAGSAAAEGGNVASEGGGVSSEQAAGEGGLTADGATPKAELTTALVRDDTSSLASEEPPRYTTADEHA